MHYEKDFSKVNLQIWKMLLSSISIKGNRHGDLFKITQKASQAHQEQNSLQCFPETQASSIVINLSYKLHSVFHFTPVFSITLVSANTYIES